jgi:N-acyl amino acid synthase FeeM
MSAVALAYTREHKPAPAREQESPNGLVVRVFQLLERIDYRLAESEEDRSAIGRLRYDAYLREGAIGPDPSQSFTDPHDDDKNAWTFGVYVDDELAASLRLHVATKDCPVFPTLSVFPDLLEPHVQAGKTIIDPTRLVTDQRLARLYPSLPYITLRLCWMAAMHFEADLSLAAVRPEHQAFYRRTFNQRPVCEPRPYPLLNKPISLMAVDHKSVSEYVYRRYPFFHSTHFERRMLFERRPALPAVIPLHPLPGEQLPLPAEQLQLFAQAS